MRPEARPGSLRLRLSLAAAALIALALSLAGLGLTLVLDGVLDARAAADLDRTAKLLAGEVARAPDGSLRLATEPRDPRFATPYGGLYWQIQAPPPSGLVLRSRSLWDKRLSPPVPLPEPGAAFDLAGPDGSGLIAVARRVAIGHAGDGEAVPLTILAAMDRRELAVSRTGFLRLLVPGLVGLGLLLALAMSLFVAQALAPFRNLRAALRAIHEGRSARMPGGYPEEVQPLVDDLNRMLGAQEQALQRARTGAGDMAHGLKTPLAVLSALARRTADEAPGLAAEIEEQVLAMSGQVERALARARVAAGADLRRRACPVAPVAARLVSALRRLPEADSLDWVLAVPDAARFPGDEGDLTEMLGNLLDNARKWAHRRVRVAAERRGAAWVLAIEDDGPGLDAAAIARVSRGRRWDETKPGTGFGLAISGDIAEATGARLELGRSSLGGLRVEIVWQEDDRAGPA